ncbi:MAG: sporulation protein YabP [Clostridia bacterium]|nr:sporulation protein YabP [Clostridia bacterium]
MEETNNIFHNIIVEGRKKLNISGIKDVVSFDDETIILETILGRLTIKGENLNIVSFNNETGELTAIGKLYAAVYTSDTKQSGGFISRLFR